MKARELIEKYLTFFESYGHKRIDSAPLIPENDPTVLFTTAGMHPLVPFLSGQPHPLGTRLTDVQKCIRTGDIDETGDAVHHTFFLMLGNWSLGDYNKSEAIKMSFEFLTKELKIPIKRLAVTCFAGDNDAPKDTESYDTWKSLGISEKRIAFLPKKDNWWGPAGETGPCGPDSEMFYWAPNNENKPAPEMYDPKDKRWVEIWNDVFMQYNKQKNGKFIPLVKQNVDTGLGVERVTAVLQGKEDNYQSELFIPIIKKIESLTKKKYDEATVSMRIIADHMRSSVFVLGDERGVSPSNVDQGYILRRFIRRALRHLRLLGLDLLSVDATVEIAKIIIKEYNDLFPMLETKKDFILTELKREENKFQKTLDKGLRILEKEINTLGIIPFKVGSGQVGKGKFSGKIAFDLFQSYGFPIEMTQEILTERNVSIDKKEYNLLFKKHQEISRKGAEKKFKGGLADGGIETTKLHTATHLLNQALRQVLGKDVKQKGSNITSERLRFDFNFDRKVTPEELKEIEDLVNSIIQKNLPVTKEKMKLEDAMKSGAQAEFGTKYPAEVWVYTVGDFSKEICMGPHVENTKEMGHFKIKKEQSSAAGVRRIKAILE